MLTGRSIRGSTKIYGPAYLRILRAYRRILRACACNTQRQYDFLAGKAREPCLSWNSWAAYNGVAQLPGIQSHSTVNHSIEFTTPTGVHTNHIESYWNRAKVKLKRMRGCHRSQLPSYLDEFMWRERYGQKNDEVLENIYRDIALWFPV
jgi:hypothetical protein